MGVMSPHEIAIRHVHERRSRSIVRLQLLRLFVRLDLVDEGQAAGMLTWPHPGFHGHTAASVSADDRAFENRLALHHVLPNRTQRDSACRRIQGTSW